MTVPLLRVLSGNTAFRYSFSERTTMAQQKLLIEEWLPIQVIGAESMRERGASSALPPLYFLHVWWARRPLTASRAAILASVLPAWSEGLPKDLKAQFTNRESYHAWFLRACGIFGDPVEGRKLISWAKDKGIKLAIPPYSHPRAFTVNPDQDILDTIKKLLTFTWGHQDLSVMDPFSGGGSIPFESLRYGFKTTANELNPVASVILKATLDYPFRFGTNLGQDINRYGNQLADKVRTRLEPFFPTQGGESIHAYIWARTVACPYTGKPIPLSPNWWLMKGDKPVVVQPRFDAALPEATFRIVKGRDACAKTHPDQGTIKRGNAVSPWANNQIVDGDYIKQEAQAGRMGQQLYAVAVKGRAGLDFHPPTEADLKAVRGADVEFYKLLPGWEAQGLVPNEQIPDGNKTSEPRRYGMYLWSDMFYSRQLLALCTYTEELKALRPRLLQELGNDRGNAVLTYLGFAIGKAANYNSRMVRWHSGRAVVAGTFDRHDFSFKWSHAEFDAAHNLFPWVLDQVVDAFQGITKLIDSGTAATLQIHKGSATNLDQTPTSSIQAIVVDPPYHDNVMYAECSDFFYVWMKRSLGEVFPEFFRDELTNKDDEAVANVARFADLGRNKKALATQDYERKMAASFEEMHRVLKDNGVLTVMFTHKKVEAWDTLATSLIGAGFAIHASWPVHTESEHSLHQAKKNSAASTIFITCRKRTPRSETVWWEDLKPVIRQVAREKAVEFEGLGIRGVDLYISTFGPVLQVLSEQWPVLSGELDERGNPKPLRPEVALDLAREEVINLRKKGLLLGRTLSFDPPTDWYLMAWDAFQAAEFPADEARKLALSLGMDMEREIIAEKRLVAKKASTVVIQEPRARLKKGMVDPDLSAFPSVVDAVHTAMVIYQEEGATVCEAFLKRTGLMQDPTFKACLQALINAVPRTRTKGKFNRMEAQLLDDLRLAFFDDLVAPKEEEPKVVGVTSPLTAGAGEDWMGEDEEETEDEGEGEE
jgi:adenine-specific DNA methylase